MGETGVNTWEAPPEVRAAMAAQHQQQQQQDLGLLQQQQMAFMQQQQQQQQAAAYQQQMAMLQMQQRQQQQAAMYGMQSMQQQHYPQAEGAGFGKGGLGKGACGGGGGVGGPRMTGRLKIWFGDKGFGFIEGDGAGDTFVHFKELTNAENEEMQPGVELEYSVGVDPRTGKNKARDVMVIR